MATDHITDAMVQEAVNEFIASTRIMVFGPTGAIRSAMRAALLAADRAAWQPIETAPRDGTRVLVFQGSEIANAHWWSDETGGAWIIWARGGSSSRMPNPTHWRPLPAPPKEPTP